MCLTVTVSLVSIKADSSRRKMIHMTDQTASKTLFETLKQDNIDKTIYEQAQQYAYEYLDSVMERGVYPSNEALENLKHFDEPMPDVGQLATDILRDLHTYGSPATVAQGGGRYFGFVNGNIIPASLATRWLADTWDQNAAMFVSSPIASKLEHLCETWLVDLLDLPEGTAAGFVTGTSTATMIGMLAGRNALLRKKGWDVAENGLFGAPPIRVVMSTQSHGTVRKGLSLIGIGNAQIEWVQHDEQGRIDPSQMPELDDNTLVILQAGNVNTGAFDDFTTICKLANDAGAWVHIDGAFGLWANVSAKTRHLTKDIGLADSWSVDGHKTANAPYDSGIVFCKDRQALIQALHLNGSYIVLSEQRDSMMYTPEMSRRARGIDLWAVLKNLGRNGLDAMIAGMVDNAQLFGDELRKCNFNVINDVVFNQVLVACDTPEETQITLKNIQDSRECWCGGSTWDGNPVIRISVCSWATTPDDVMRSVQAFVDARAKARETIY